MKKTEKRTKVRTRKGRALRQAAVLLGLLAAFSILHIYTFTPKGALRRTEGYLGMKRTQLLQELPGRGWNERHYMSVNDDTLLLSRAYFQPKSGWTGLRMGGFTYNTAEDAQMEWNYMLALIPQADQTQYWGVYGRIRIPEAAEIRAQSRWYYNAAEGDPDFEQGGRVDLPDTSVSSTSADWAEKDGWRYFYMEAPLTPVPKEGDSDSVRIPLAGDMTLTLLDSAGEVLGRYEPGGSSGGGDYFRPMK